MTHVMVPDGVLPWWLCVAGWVLALALLGFALWRLRGQPAARMVPLVGVVTALMVVIMSFELVPIGYEMHFTVLAGMLVGPWYGVIVALLFNILRALLGRRGLHQHRPQHGHHLAGDRPGGRHLGPAEAPGPAPRRAGRGLATFVSLLLATVVFVGVVALSAVDPGELVETGAYDVPAGGFAEAPLAGGLINVHLSEAHAADEAEAAPRPD